MACRRPGKAGTVTVLSCLLLFAGSMLLIPPAGALAAELSQDGCITADGSGGACETLPGIQTVQSLAISGDGRHVYTVTSEGKLLTFVRDSESGEIYFVAGSGGCFSQYYVDGCRLARGLRTPNHVVVSNDGRNVYVASRSSDAIAVFQRDTSTGYLTQPEGTSGCVSNTGSEGCLDGRALDGAYQLAVSPDLKNVYVASKVSNAVATLTRATTTGLLSQANNTSGCIAEYGGVTCIDGHGLQAARAIEVSHDGNQVYSGASGADAIAVLNRATNGALSQSASSSGCVSLGGYGCATGRAINGPIDLEISADDDFLYVASYDSSSVAIFQRGPNGVLTQLAGSDGCHAAWGLYGCQSAYGLLGVSSVELSPNGDLLYTASKISDAVVTFSRDVGTGKISQLSGQAGCTSETGDYGYCKDGTGLVDAQALLPSHDDQNVYMGGQSTIAIFSLGLDSSPNPNVPQPPSTSPPNSDPDDGDGNDATRFDFDIEFTDDATLRKVFKGKKNRMRKVLRKISGPAFNPKLKVTTNRDVTVSVTVKLKGKSSDNDNLKADLGRHDAYVNADGTATVTFALDDKLRKMFARAATGRYAHLAARAIARDENGEWLGRLRKLKLR